MKNTYSIILLFAFLIGTLQPILPMIEYQLFEGSIIELLASRGNRMENVESSACIHSEINKQDCEHASYQDLLDADFYPLALNIVTIPKPKAFIYRSRFYLPPQGSIAKPTLLPNIPPPRLS